MKPTKIISHIALALTLGCAVSLASAASAHEEHDTKAMAHKTAAGQLVRVTEKDAAWAAKALAEYPTDVCVVSEDKLGTDMGKPQDFIYREEGKADRLVRFCCNDCVKDFNEYPAKYLGMIDTAAKKAAK
jgi:hypothetical protein